MVVLGGSLFLMSEVPLQHEKLTLHAEQVASPYIRNCPTLSPYSGFMSRALW